MILVLAAIGCNGKDGPEENTREDADAYLATGSYLWAFIPAAVMCLIASIMAVIVKAPGQKKAPLQ